MEVLVLNVLMSGCVAAVSDDTVPSGASLYEATALLERFCEYLGVSG